MPLTLTWDGLSELRQALRALPENLKGEASNIVEGAANDAAGRVRTAYPLGPTGNLRSRVFVTHYERGKFVAEARLKSAAPHAHLFEFGTVQRRNKHGANRGRMPKAPRAQAAIPQVQAARRRMVNNLIDLVRRHGLLVDVA